MKKLPLGEETLPIAEVGGRLLTHKQLARQVSLTDVSDNLLAERIKLRAKQGRERTIYRIDGPITPKDQLAHIKAKDELGKEFLAAERKLLEAELKVIYGN